jgi:2-polyprenyl-3-methyl-5-hydroxy-6-metoxy-1,4-benzoquinol methylase
MMIKEFFKCSNCGANRGKVKYQFAEAGRSIVRCDSCGVMVIEPFPIEEDLKQVYCDEYFQNKDLLKNNVEGIYGYVDYIYDRINRQREHRKICRKIDTYLIPLNSCKPSLLDYGCGLGFFMDTAYDFNLSVSGVEFNEYAINYIRQRYTYKITTNKEFIKSSDTYDVITLFDVIEHLMDPFDFLSNIGRILNENGLLVMSTMDSNSVVSRLIGGKLEDFRRVKEHLYFFSRDNMASIMAKNGFEVLEVSSIGHSFELNQLCARIKTIFPVVGSIVSFFINFFPFVGRMSIYVNPFTKFIMYARKLNNTESLKITSEKKISIIIPVYNEELFVEKVINKVLSVNVGMQKEIIIVNDGSTDQTLEIVKKTCSTYNDIIIIDKIHMGKGAAVAEGIKASSGDYVIIQDGDLEYNPEDIPLLLSAMFKTGANVVYGTRFHGSYRRTGYLLTTIGNRMLTIATNIINNINLSDMGTGYKLFNGNVIRKIKITSKGFDFEPEVTCKICRMKIAIYEVPISFKARSYYEGKKIKIKDSFWALKALVKYGILNLD